MRRRCTWRTCVTPAQLLGFYHGVPLTGRTRGYHLVAPDRISLYRQPILLQCHSAEEVRAGAPRVTPTRLPINLASAMRACMS